MPASPLPDPRRLLRSARATARTLAPVVRSAVTDPGMRRTLLGRGGAPATAATGGDVPDLPAPTGATDLARHVSAQAHVAAGAAEVADLLTDLTRTHEWLSLHAAWRGERADRMVSGEHFTQQIRLMDIPAQARWQVERADETGFALSGTGPMGITLGLWATLAADGGRTAVRLDAGLEGPPVRGPVGLTAVRSVETALLDSLTALGEVLAGGGRLRVPTDPVHHEATGRDLDPSTPVVVGVGQVVQREPDLDDPREPTRMAVEALRAALADSGASADLLAAADLVYAVPSASWAYPDQAGRVAALVGAERAGTVQTSTYGGDGGQLAVNDAAQQVVDGAADVVLVSGAEAGATVAALQARGRTPDWPQQPAGSAPDRVVGLDRAANNEAETAVGLGAPIYAYALMESALRGAAGRDEAEHRGLLARLWSRLSVTAAANPYAWDPTARTPEELGTVTADNRAVSEPYPKLMCANLQVDLAAGLIVTSVAAAQAAGVPQERWVFVHAGASAVDEWFVSERADLTSSPAIAAAGAAALAHAGVKADDLGPVDLYSCFPAAVQIGAAALGLPVDDPDRPLSVTGGLTFAGGPGNDYGTHAVATMVPLLRDDPAAYGLSTSLGWYATKHAMGIYSATPPERAFAHLRPVVPRPPSRRARTELEGEGVVEALTRPHARDGSVEAAILSVLTPDGDRVLLRHEDDATLALLAGTDVLHRPVRVVDGALVVTGERVASLPAPPRAPVRTERAGPDGAVLVVTLDRPEVRNAIDLRTAVALERAIDDAEADESVRAIVLTGAGETFCAGMDLAGAHRGEVPVTEGRGPLGLTARPPVKPMIAAVEGVALAGGFELVLCADLVVATTESAFGLPEPQRGLLAAAGGLWRIGTRLPRPVALELALLAQPLPAKRLAALGMVNRVVEPGRALATALGLAEQLVANAPLSVTVGKQVVDAAPGWSPDEGFERQTELATPVVLSADAQEGVAAYAEKRAPRWSGR